MILLRDDILVDPYYEGDTVEVKGFLIPKSAHDPMSYTGEVVSVGPDQKDVRKGDQVLYHSFDGHPVTERGHEYLVIRAESITGYLTPDGEVFPLPDDVLARPYWLPREERTESGLIVLNRWNEKPSPPALCTVIRRGERVTSVARGDVITVPAEGGAEVAVKDTVWYTLHAKDIEAKFTGDPRSLRRPDYDAGARVVHR